MHATVTMSRDTAPTAESRSPEHRTAARPKLPRGAEAGADALTALRRFHFDLPVEEDVAPKLPAGLLPALLHAYRGTPVRGEYPVFVPPAGAGAEALPLSFGEVLERALPAEGSDHVLRDNLRRLERQVRRLLEEAEGEPAEARALLRRAGRALRDELALTAEDDARLGEALEGLVAGVPADGRLVPWGSAAPLHLLRAAARARLQPARAAFLEEARQVAAGLAGILDAARRQETPGSGGALGSRFVDPGRLGALTGAAHTANRLEPERRQRLEAARRTLDAFIAGGTLPASTLVLPVGRAADGLDEAWDVVAAAEPFDAAAERFDRNAAELAAVLRAMRLARLELAGDYAPERHGPVLERFDWHAFSEAEAALLAPVVAVASADHAAGAGLRGLSRLLLSGRPVQVLVESDPSRSPGRGAEEDGSESLLGYRFEPASLGVGLREAFVQQSSLARPVHLAAGLARALSSGRASLHVLDTPPVADPGEASASLDPWLVAGAALEGRAHPLFLYDPEAGEGWARRLDFSRNPEPSRDWPEGELAAVQEGGGEVTLPVAFTFADYALLAPALRGELRPVPAGLDHDDLVPIADWLALERADAGHKVPWIWAVDRTGTLHRLAVSRRLAHACRDRLDYWRTLQEMAGVRSEYAERAARAARDAAEEAARREAERRADDHARELEHVRRTAAEEVVDRITAGLLELDVAALPRPQGGGVRLAGSVDEVAAQLLAAVGDLEARTEAAPSTPEAEALTRRLLAALDTESLPS